MLLLSIAKEAPFLTTLTIIPIMDKNLLVKLSNSC